MIFATLKAGSTLPMDTSAIGASGIEGTSGMASIMKRTTMITWITASTTDLAIPTTAGSSLGSTEAKASTEELEAASMVEASRTEWVAAAFMVEAVMAG